MIKYKLFDKTNLKGIAIAGALSLSAAFMAVPSACVYADTPVQSQTADTDSSEPLSEDESEKDNPAAGDIGDTPGYNLEKTKKQSVEENENSTRQDSEIDLSARPYPASDNVINSDSYYNLGALTNYEQYINMSFDVAENDVTRLQVIYSGNSPEFAFFNPEKQIYAGSNKTYENGFSIVKKTRSDYMSIGQSNYNVDVYYIEYPKTGGSWIAQMSAVGVKDVICSKTKLPKNWQNLSASKEGAVDMDGPTFYSLADSSNIVTLTDSSGSFDANGESADKKIKAVKEEDKKDYSSLIMCGTFLAIMVVGFIVFKVKSNKKAKAAEEKTKKEKELAEYKESRKRTTEQIEEDLTKEFEKEGEDWSDVQIEWDTKPTVLEMPEEKKESKAIKKRVSQIKEVNAEYTNTVIRDAQKAQSKKNEEERSKVPSYDESDSVILNPVIPNVPDTGNDDDLF